MTASKRWSTLLKPALVFGAGFAKALVAQTYSDLPQRIELKRVDLSRVPGNEPSIPPTRTTFLNLRDVPLKLFTVHVVDNGQPLYDFSK